MGEKEGNAIWERRMLSTIPVFVEWMRENKKITHEQLLMMERLFPEQFDLASGWTFEQLIEFISSHRNSSIYGKDIEVILSQSGMEWIKDAFDKLQKYRKL